VVGEHPQVRPDDLLDRRLVMVTGKGGTGKTTVAAALAWLSAARGQKTLLCEVDNQRSTFAPIFGQEAGFEPVHVRENLHMSNVLWEPSLAAFLSKIVPVPRMAKKMLAHSGIAKFLDFTPGSREIVTLSTLTAYVDSYDLVIVDMPASGHAFSLLDITRSAMSLFRSGPVRRRAEELRERLIHPDSVVVFVALPEEMVVNETVETLEKMSRYELLGAPPAVVLNRAVPPTMTPQEVALLERLTEATLTDVAREFVRAGQWEAELELATSAARDRLTDACDGRAPLLLGPAPPGGNPRAVVRSVAVALARAVGMSPRDLEWT
jgi:arsenite-transporting ATPase